MSILGSIKTFICVYVNDIIITRSNKVEIEKVISRLSEVFPIRDLGELKIFLGIQVRRGTYSLYLSQAQYLGNLLKTYDMENLQPVATPMIANLNLLSDEEPIDNAKDY